MLSKKIALGVTGGIAAYKSCELIRQLKRQGAEVRTAMTASAEEFIGELTLATLSENSVSKSLFEGNEKLGTTHIELARWCDLLVLCPATANIIGKAALGLADELISTTILATRAPVIFCPAMNFVMWEKQIVQENIKRLKDSGYFVIDPEWGALATTEEGEGWGRLASIDMIMQSIKRTLLGRGDLDGKKILVTAGPTRAAIDPVRFITNHSSGKMGFALAEAAQLRGAEVVLIAGPNHLPPVYGVRYVGVESAEEMQSAVEDEYADADILLMAAAVSDYQPRDTSGHKIKKSSDVLHLELVKSTDILASLSAKKEHRMHVGFALETEDGIANARKKLLSKNLDLIVLNNPLEAGAGFGGDTNVVTLIDNCGSHEILPKLSKNEIAERILDRIQEMQSSHNKVAAN